MADRAMALGGLGLMTPDVEFRGRWFHVRWRVQKALTARLTLFRQGLVQRAVADLREVFPPELMAEAGLDPKRMLAERLAEMNAEFAKGEAGKYGETGEEFGRWQRTVDGGVALLIAFLVPQQANGTFDGQVTPAEAEEMMAEGLLEAVTRVMETRVGKSTSPSATTAGSSAASPTGT